MELGRSGRVWRWPMGAIAPRSEPLAVGLRFAFGVLARADRRRARRGELAPPRLSVGCRAAARPGSPSCPGYPSRMAPARGGGFWLSCFVRRTQLVEFVLREPAYRRRMMAEIDPRYWIAPALSSGASFLEPLQGAGVKQMGVLKPWAPPRSYGLVLRIGADGRVLRVACTARSTAATTASPRSPSCGGDLFAASKRQRSPAARRRCDALMESAHERRCLELRQATKKYRRRPGDQERRFRRSSAARSTRCSARTAPASRR